MSRIGRFLFLVVTAAGGCAANEDIWMPPGDDGKADGGSSILSGADIPSQFVDATKHYSTKRSIPELVEVNALRDARLTAAMRADTIFADKPRNGRLEAAELVALEAPQTLATLTAEERAALPALWSMLEVPDIEQHLAYFDFAIEDRSVPLADTVLAVPEPGYHDTSFVMGSFAVKHWRDIEIREGRTVRTFIPDFFGWSSSFGVFETEGATLDMNASGDLLVRELSIGYDRVLTTTHSSWPAHTPGEIVFERYVNGDLAESHRVTSVGFDIYPKSIVMFDKLDYKLVTLDGTPLFRNVTLGHNVTAGVEGQWLYDLVDHPNPAADPTALAALATPVSSLAPGRYNVAVPGNATHLLDLYENGVVMIDGKPLAHTSRGGLKALFFDSGHLDKRWVFVPSTNHLYLEKPTLDLVIHVVTDVVVTPAMRTP